MLRGCRGCWTCYWNTTSMLASFRPSRHVQMVWCVANMSTSSCRAYGIWRTTLQMDKRAKNIRN